MTKWANERQNEWMNDTMNEWVKKICNYLKNKKTNNFPPKKILPNICLLFLFYGCDLLLLLLLFWKGIFPEIYDVTYLFTTSVQES